MVAGDDIHTTDELIRCRARELKNATLIGYPKEGVADYEEHSAHAIDRYVDAAAEILQQRGLTPVNGDLEKAPVVGILANSSLHVLITILGLSRLGYAVLLLSTRLASPAIRRLLDLAECNTVLTTETFRPVLGETQKEEQLILLDLLARADYFRQDAPVFSRSYEAEKETCKTAVIIHSSGSTGLPKPIYLTHRSCIGAFATNLDMRALITSPLFHSQAFYETFRSIYSGKPIYYCNYSLPLTKQNLIDMIEHVKPDLLHCVPYVLKLLSESHEGVQCLASVKLVLFAGSACPDDLGDRLVKSGVNLVANYGATETGRLMNSVRPPGDLIWNYLRILPIAKPYVLMDEISPGVYECVCLDGLKSKSTTNSDDPPRSFRTRDLFSRHSERPDLWKYLSRLDDRLTLTLGEKVLPLLIEGRIRQEPLVEEAVVFGEGRTIPGVLVVRAEPARQLSDEAFREQIWPAIEDANSKAEAFSRIPVELVVMLRAGQAYPKTDKGTFIRAQVYAQFKEQIDDAYARFENTQGGTKTFASIDELEQYLLQMFREHLGVQLKDADTDFFAFGIDSLQCIKMWTLIKRDIDLEGRQSELGQNVLYETGNVRSLAKHLDALRSGTSATSKSEHEWMEELIAKYSSFPPLKTPAQRVEPGSGEVVLLTGVTGGLGAHLLAQLVSNLNVTTVWAFVRASSDEEALNRVLHSLKARSIQLMDTNMEHKIIAVASDLSKPDFGISNSLLLEKLRNTVTVTIHSAWAVNFNLPVQSFEDQHIKAVHNLINFCRSSPAKPARFFFCSSVSAAGGTPKPGTVAEGPVTDIAHVQGTGYAQSKYVAEHITLAAMRHMGFEARVLRVGQLVGDSRVGEWNPSEGIPLMIQTAHTLGALPALDEEMSWLPVDYAAKIILDLCRIKTFESGFTMANHVDDPDVVYHVLNPARFHWTHDMLSALSAAGLSFEVLSTEKWMAKLRASSRDPVLNPPIKLLDWFESKYSDEALERNKGKGPLVYLTEDTAKASETVGILPDVTDTAFVRKMVDRLRVHWDGAAETE